ncbi:DNA primase DnaG [Halobaculum sp. P14]|uniref:DNA primase DnaG n=1 Tax=Halobaculum sp. P14 TaxID=3421638 RepID=UPI003EBAB55D
MDDSAKYLIHARITADGVVERSDVVGAVFGQTEGLLGDELDLRDLQQRSKVGRIDVDVDSENGQSFGRLTIASGLDKVETSILAASLEAITRVGPCEARVEVTDIEDMRAAQRREVVDRAKELLNDSFDESVMDSKEILDEVREAHRVDRIDEYEGLPAGARVRDSDAVIVVEGRSDVLTLLRYGIKNGVAVEGTNVPDAVADLTGERTVTAFLDGDRGGELILRELAQVGDVDYVAFAPSGRSVEDLARHEVMAALREKMPLDAVDLGGSSPADERIGSADRDADPDADSDADADGDAADDAGEGADATPGIDRSVAVTTGRTAPAEPSESSESADSATKAAEPTTDAAAEAAANGAAATAAASEQRRGSKTESAESAESAESTQSSEASAESTAGPSTLREHVREVVDAESNRARLLDADYGVLAEVPAAEAFDAVSDADEAPFALVVDGELTQKVLDVAAQRGVSQVVCATEGDYVKRPASVRVLTAEQLSAV